MSHTTDKAVRAAFIGSAGIPNRYGGFEGFLEHCAPAIAERIQSCAVTCDAVLYEDRSEYFEQVRRVFIGVPANGAWSMLHDAIAFFSIFRTSTHIVVLGVSGGLWFPLFRMLCALTGKKLLVNIDGVEWRRTKFGRRRRALLRLLDTLAQVGAHVIVYDNPALRGFVLECCRNKARCIGYAGDHVLRLPDWSLQPGTALTVCRIEPENQLEMLIDAALNSDLRRYTIVGNWEQSEYGRRLRARHVNQPRLALLDPVYDASRLAALREQAACYLHGHSVGGTNPSLVEMLFYDCRLLCFDCVFNRATANAAAEYFESAEALKALLRELPDPSDRALQRRLQREHYTQARIADDYVAAMIDA
jgi:glycosyltransferase involved in cell wall biosynthesis